MGCKEAVWITGVGAATPLGTDPTSVAESILNGRSAVGLLTDSCWQQHPSRLGARLAAIPAPSCWSTPAFRQLDPLAQMFLWCGCRALEGAGLNPRRQPRIGLILGLGAEALRHWELQGGEGSEPEESVLHVVHKGLKLGGPSTLVAAACASGNVAFALARSWLRQGLVDQVLVGAGELGVTPLSLACFGNLRVLSRRHDSPEAASRPFDRRRDGFVPGEGGVLFVVEKAATARQRGVKPLAELAGIGISSDAFHLVSPSPEPAVAGQALRAALAQAEVSPDEIDYINAHAPGTMLGDRCEAQVLRAILGPAVRRVPVSSTKSMSGHLLSGAAALEALIAILALQHQALPPTINLDDPDPTCELNHVRHHALERRVRVVVSNSYGFGGSNTSLVLRKVG